MNKGNNSEYQGNFNGTFAESELLERIAADRRSKVVQAMEIAGIGGHLTAFKVGILVAIAATGDGIFRRSAARIGKDRAVRRCERSVRTARHQLHEAGIVSITEQAAANGNSILICMSINWPNVDALISGGKAVKPTTTLRSRLRQTGKFKPANPEIQTGKSNRQQTGNKPANSVSLYRDQLPVPPPPEGTTGSVAVAVEFGNWDKTVKGGMATATKPVEVAMPDPVAVREADQIERLNDRIDQLTEKLDTAVAALDKATEALKEHRGGGNPPDRTRPPKSGPAALISSLGDEPDAEAVAILVDGGNGLSTPKAREVCRLHAVTPDFALFLINTVKANANIDAGAIVWYLQNDEWPGKVRESRPRKPGEIGPVEARKERERFECAAYAEAKKRFPTDGSQQARWIDEVIAKRYGNGENAV